MLPVQDVMPSRTTPRAILGLMTAIVAVLALQLPLTEHAVRGLILSYGLVPAHLSWQALLTYAFLHHGIVDTGVNVLALWIFGDNVEDRLGPVRTIALFLAGSVLAGLAVGRVAPDAMMPLVGAAGGVGALVGAHLRLFRQARVMMLVPDRHGVDLVDVPAQLVAMAWLVLIAVITAMWTAPLSGLMTATTVVPVAGMLAGVVLVRLLARPERLRCGWWNEPVQLPDRRRTSRDTSASSASSVSN